MLEVAVAASGGADGMALLMEALRRFPGSQIIVLTVDHGTRAAATRERAHVLAAARTAGIRAEEITVRVSASHHAAWREARVGALLRFCEAADISRLWLGHHRDDATETAAIRVMAKGPLEAGAGISAERKAGSVTIERPLLNRTARDIRRGLMAVGVAWMEDPSNRNPRYLRTAVRTLLRREDASAKRGVLVRRIGWWRAERDRVFRAAWELAAGADPDGFVRIKPGVLTALPPSLAVAVLRESALLTVGRAQRLRKADFVSVLARHAPCSLGGAYLWQHGSEWLLGRDYRHIRQRSYLRSRRKLEWDGRYRLHVPSWLPPGCWRLERLGTEAARRIEKPLPAELMAASPAIWGEGGLAAAPVLGVWRGTWGPYWAANLAWERLPRETAVRFRVAQ